MNENQEGVVSDKPIIDEEVAIIDTYDSEAMKQFALQRDGKFRHWRDKAKKLEQELNQLKQTKKGDEEIIKKEEVKKTPDVNPFDSLVEIQTALRDLNTDEISELKSEAGLLGVDPIKYIKSKAGQAHLKELRGSQKSNDATPAPSNKVPTFNGKTVDDVLKDPKASSEDKQKAFEAKLRGVKNKNTFL